MLTIPQLQSQIQLNAIMIFQEICMLKSLKANRKNRNKRLSINRIQLAQDTSNPVTLSRVKNAEESIQYHTKEIHKCVNKLKRMASIQGAVKKTLKEAIVHARQQKVWITPEY